VRLSIQNGVGSSLKALAQFVTEKSGRTFQQQPLIADELLAYYQAALKNIKVTLNSLWKL
jgi:hypothetical protein